MAATDTDGARRVRSASASWLPRADLPTWQRTLRYHLTRLFVWIAFRVVLRIRLEGVDRLVDGPAMYCMNHLGWSDPFVVLAAFPAGTRLYFYGPREETLLRGRRNRLMRWTGMAVPFRPTKDDLISSVRRAEAVFESGASLVIAGEGQIHVHEGDLMPLQEGAAFLALRARVPIVPLAITGTSWLGFRRLVRVRVGKPIPTGPRPTRDAIRAYTSQTWHALRTMVADDTDLEVPGPFGRWFTDVFNDWGPDGRTGAATRTGPLPEDVPLPEPQPAG